MSDPFPFAVNLAQQTGELLRQYAQEGRQEARWKADGSLVTQADLAADQLIVSAIQRAFPADLLISEESVSTGLPEAERAMWVIDPLDGTTNFHLGLPFWGVLITRLQGGWPELAALYFPLLNELYTARRGQGAWLNGQPLQTQPEHYRHLSFFACCSRAHKRYRLEIPYKTRILGCAAYTLCAVARNIALLGFEATPMLWDIAGAWLVVQEAGGTVAALDGRSPLPLRPDLDYTRQSFPILAASNSERWEWGRAHIFQK